VCSLFRQPRHTLPLFSCWDTRYHFPWETAGTHHSESSSLIISPALILSLHLSPLWSHSIPRLHFPQPYIPLLFLLASIPFFCCFFSFHPPPTLILQQLRTTRETPFSQQLSLPMHLGLHVPLLQSSSSYLSHCVLPALSLYMPKAFLQSLSLVCFLVRTSCILLSKKPEALTDWLPARDKHLQMHICSSSSVALERKTRFLISGKPSSSFCQERTNSVVSSSPKLSSIDNSHLLCINCSIRLCFPLVLFPLLLLFCFALFFVFQTGFLYVALAVLEFSLYTRLTSNSRDSPGLKECATITQAPPVFWDHGFALVMDVCNSTT
jgi:hypothetical protein